MTDYQGVFEQIELITRVLTGQFPKWLYNPDTAFKAGKTKRRTIARLAIYL